MSADFLLESKLMNEAPELHQRVRDSVFVLQGMLERFLPRFPDFTDHSILHSLDVLDYSNRLLGSEQIARLSPGECYVLIMACYLHDIGMGVGQKDFEEFSRKIEFGNYFDTHDTHDSADEAETIRAFHNEYSGYSIRKYASLLEIPTEDTLFFHRSGVAGTQENGSVRRAGVPRAANGVRRDPHGVSRGDHPSGG